MPTLRIAPSILASDFSRLGEEIRAVEAAGADWIHIDVMDGHFVPNLTIGPGIVEAVRRCTDLPLDVHLMIETPDRYVGDFASAGADTIGVHVEACPHLHRSIQTIKEAGVRACAVINPATPASTVEPILAEVDQVLVMTVNPGFGGQKFIRSALSAVKQIRGWIQERDLDVDVEVDGGITADTIGEAAQAGANAFVAGTAVFGTDDYKAAMDALRQRSGLG
ncbi:MAG TPA: ribulose-phosphate 3-epimerase [Myxococcales bacterium]|nr:ribulose-phosphate 3-epimerase [Myxococcales bacterium]